MNPQTVINILQNKIKRLEAENLALVKYCEDLEKDKKDLEETIDGLEKQELVLRWNLSGYEGEYN